ncbi:Hypothetical protein NTJ_01302 [Nesidiocoris tenuis]|uniref:Uncharacterized protein n=1 Tax=Nesidiocoris tenuis TaxID=355587 RepID=A0ABN7A890_9HEMI|nr:Hypothetical protein NTJ_01302 [Nesidiocoris tenuis]
MGLVAQEHYLHGTMIVVMTLFPLNIRPLIVEACACVVRSAVGLRPSSLIHDARLKCRLPPSSRPKLLQLAGSLGHDLLP